MDREPTPVLLTREDDRLPLQRSLGTSAGRHLGAHVVDEHCDIADALDSYRAGFAGRHPEVVFCDPPIPQSPVGSRCLETLPCVVEDERCVVGEAGKVVLKLALAEGGDQPVGGRLDLNITISHRTHLPSRGVAATKTRGGDSTRRRPRDQVGQWARSSDRPDLCRIGWQVTPGLPLQRLIPDEPARGPAERFARTAGALGRFTRSGTGVRRPCQRRPRGAKAAATIDLDEVRRTRTWGTADVTRPWSQFADTDRRSNCPSTGAASRLGPGGRNDIQPATITHPGPTATSKGIPPARLGQRRGERRAAGQYGADAVVSPWCVSWQRRWRGCG